MELPYAASPLAMAEKEQEAPFYVKLRTTVSGDGKTFKLRDATSPNCAKALKRIRAEHPYDPTAAEPVEELIKQVCDARGTYHWTGKRVE